MRHRTIGVIGLDDTGLSLALGFCEKGFQVIGVDLDEVNGLADAKTCVHQSLTNEWLIRSLSRYLHDGKFRVVTRPAVAAWEGNAYIVTVGVSTPAGIDYRKFDITMRQLGNVIKPNDLVVIRSLVAPDAIESRIIPILEQHSRMVVGLDFHLAYVTRDKGKDRSGNEIETCRLGLAGVTRLCCAAAEKLLGTLDARAMQQGK